MRWIDFCDFKTNMPSCGGAKPKLTGPSPTLKRRIREEIESTPLGLDYVLILWSDYPNFVDWLVQLPL